MQPQIETSPPKKLIGKRMTMSLSTNKTGELWKSFMIKRQEIRNVIGPTLYSIQIYDSSYYKNFSLVNEFEKWATIEVTDFDHVPDGMETFILPGGLYAIFVHQGPASEGSKTFQYIFEKWLPQSPYLPDDRPHFEALGEKYKNDHADSEEEIWIPIRKR